MSRHAMRRGAAARLHESEALYRAVVERSADGIAIVQGTTYVFANAAAAALVGLNDPTELIGQPIDAFIAATDAQRVRRFALARQRGGPAPARYEVRLRRADGAERTVEIAAAPVTFHGQPASLAVIRDVTERREAERHVLELNARLRAALTELEAAQSRLVEQERLRALGEMASGIAHDLNNALAPVLGFTDLLLSTPEQLRNPTAARRYMGLIRAGAEDAAGVVARLREFFRQRDAAEGLQPVDVAPLVEQVIALARPRWRDQAQAAGRTIQVETALDPVPPVAGNAPELRAALTNLLFNAIDAMPRGGTITIGCRLDQLPTAAAPGAPDTPQAPPTAVALWVRDTGTGMSEETRRRALEPFFTTKGEHGTGLGLSMVFGTVRRHGGALDVESTLDAGTTVTLLLPLYESLSAAARAQPAAPPARTRAVRRLNVLVVDDDPAVRQVTEAMLDVDGHRVTAVGGGREALEALQRAGAAGPNAFQLVVTDHAMPDMAGDQLAATIKQIAPGVGVILLTGFGGLMSPSERGAADAVLAKPVTIADLRAAIARTVHPPAQ